MLKLNNRGWGLQIMMVFILILMIGLVITAVLIKQNFGGIFGEVLPDTSKSIEEVVVLASQQYQKEYYNDMLDGEKITVTLKTLKSKNLIKDVKYKDKQCSGYAIFSKKNDKIDHKAYLKCGADYGTKGYLEQFDR
ncbi:MAG: hypothetical protein RSB71_02595 [Bacilli bacterium]